MRYRCVADSLSVKGLARLVAALLLIVLLIPAFAHAAESQFNIYYSGSEDLVLNRLLLDPTTHRVANLDDAATAVYQDNLPAAGPDLDALKARVASGMGVVLILGRHTDANALASFTNGAIKQTGIVDVAAGATHGRELERLAAVVNWVGPKTDPLARNISWLSAVRVHERSLLDRQRRRGAGQDQPRDPVAPGTPILLRIHSGKGTIYVLNEWLRNGDQRARIASMLTMLGGIEGAENYDFQRWPYFNWLLYAMSRTAAGVPAVAYGDWIASPVPNRAQVRILAALVFAMFAMFVIAYVLVRRYSLRHPELLDHFYRSTPSAKPQPASLGAAAAAPVPAESKGDTAHGDPRWEIVGFHRPLSGFFYNYLLSLMIMIPFNFAVTFYIERNFVNPFLEARGAWAAVTQFMLIFFTLLDLGTSQAMVKYFAEYRLTDPGRAITFAQFFIWFHAIAGMFQIAALGLAAADLSAAYSDGLPRLVRRLAHDDSVPRLHLDFLLAVPRAAALRLRATADRPDLRAESDRADDLRRVHAPLGPDASGVRRRDGRGVRLRHRRRDRQPADGPVLFDLLRKDGLQPGDDFPRAFRPRDDQEIDHLRREAHRRTACGRDQLGPGAGV